MLLYKCDLVRLNPKNTILSLRYRERARKALLVNIFATRGSTRRLGHCAACSTVLYSDVRVSKISLMMTLLQLFLLNALKTIYTIDTKPIITKFNHLVCKIEL
jgi:hypothetical protein